MLLKMNNELMIVSAVWLSSLMWMAHPKLSVFVSKPLRQINHSCNFRMCTISKECNLISFHQILGASPVGSSLFSLHHNRNDCEIKKICFLRINEHMETFLHFVADRIKYPIILQKFRKFCLMTTQMFCIPRDRRHESETIPFVAAFSSACSMVW